MLTFAILTWILIGISRIKKNRADKHKEAFVEIVSTELLPHFYDDIETLKIQGDAFAKKYLKSNQHKQFTVNILLEQTNNFLGDAFETIQALYSSMKLDEFSSKKLGSKHWYTTCRGLQELGSFRNDNYVDQIRELLKHKHKTVNKVALQTLMDIRTGAEFPKESITGLDRPISLWEQVMLYENMHKLEKIQQWKLHELLNAPDSVFAFGLKVACLGNSSFLNNPEVIKKAITIKDEQAIIAFIEWAGRFDVSEPIHSMFIHRHVYNERIQERIIEQSYILNEIENSLREIIEKESNRLAMAAAIALDRSYDITKIKIKNPERIHIFEQAQNPLIHV